MRPPPPWFCTKTPLSWPWGLPPSVAGVISLPLRTDSGSLLSWLQSERPPRTISDFGATTVKGMTLITNHYLRRASAITVWSLASTTTNRHIASTINVWVAHGTRLTFLVPSNQTTTSQETQIKMFDLILQMAFIPVTPT